MSGTAGAHQGRPYANSIPSVVKDCMSPNIEVEYQRFTRLIIPESYPLSKTAGAAWTRDRHALS